MDYFNNRKNVILYTEMMKGYDNNFVIGEVNKILPKGSKLLELGMGTGIDLISLSSNYDVVGSDNSKYFVNDFKRNNELEAMILDAVNINIQDKFDCIYSNKVLQHLSKEDFVKSLISQYNHLSNNGMIFATLWSGMYKETFEFDGQLRFIYYNETILRKIIPNVLKIEKIVYYSEFETDDSLIMVLRKNDYNLN